MTTRGRPLVGTKVQVRLPSDLLEAIDREAAVDDIPRAAEIRRLLYLAIEERERT